MEPVFIRVAVGRGASSVSDKHHSLQPTSIGQYARLRVYMCVRVLSGSPSCNCGQTFTCQACTFWKWGKFLGDVTPRGKTLVRINLDETSVAHVPDTIRGLVVSRRHWGPYGRRPVVRSKKTRGAVTYVALICDSPSLQPKLPQFILGNERRLTRNTLAVAEDERPPNVRVWRDKSSWNNHTVMCRILRALASVLRTQAPYFQPALVLDVAACHLHASVMQTAII